MNKKVFFNNNQKKTFVAIFFRRDCVVMENLKSTQSRFTVLTFQDDQNEPGCDVLRDRDTIKLIKSRNQIQVIKNERNATPATLTESDLLQNDKLKLNRNFHKQQIENQCDVNADADLNDIVNEVSCVSHFLHLISTSICILY